MIDSPPLTESLDLGILLNIDSIIRTKSQNTNTMEGNIMKITDKKKPVRTIPNGVWESSRPAQNKENQNPASETTDLQGNGYPQKQSK